MKKTVGGYVIGDNFWDREAETRLFIEKIKEGSHLSLVAQRRMGKTSLLLEVARRIKKDYITLYVDLQEAFSAPDIITKISVKTHEYKPLWKKTTELFSNTLGSVRKAIDTISIHDVEIHLRGGLDSGNWSRKGDQLLEVLANSDVPILLMLDEVPIAVNRMLKGQDFIITQERKRDVDAFMSWLRSNSIKHQGRIRIVLTGSIGFEPVLHQAGLSATLNTFETFELRPWDHATAIGCLQALAKEYNIQFPDGAERIIVDTLGCCIPNHVQMFFSHIYDHCVRHDRQEFFAKEVDEIYQSDILGTTRGHAELTHYEERLKIVLGTELLPLALDMLSEAAITGCLNRIALKALQQEYTFQNGTAAEVEGEILRVLEHDGYLKSTNGGYVFVSHLLRDWWKKRYSMIYTPLSDREGTTEHA